MTQEEYKEMLEGVGVPVRYNHGENGLAVPFIYYTFVRAPLLNADNKRYAVKNKASVSIVTTTKEKMNILTARLEDIFSDNEIAFGEPVEGWDDDEKIYINTYDTEV